MFILPFKSKKNKLQIHFKRDTDIHFQGMTICNFKSIKYCLLVIISKSLLGQKVSGSILVI